MHRCLNVDEIVRLIACELIASGRKATAVCLACCCKGFEDPVLDALWATQSDLPTLFKCYPGDIWNEGGYAVSTPTTYVRFFLNGSVRKSFKRLPTATEWARFRKYARRMRGLDHHGTQKPLSSEVYSVMQLHAANEPLLPNLKTLYLWRIEGSFIPFVPLLFSPTITSISLGSLASYLTTPVVASVIANLSTSCPNLQDIDIWPLPRDPIITAAASKMFFATNRNVLRSFHVDSPLTEEATEAIYKLQNLCGLSAVIEKGTQIPSASLPNLIHLKIESEDGSDELQFLRRATFGKLKSFHFGIESRPTDGFLEAFKGAALSSSIQDTLSKIYFITDWSWNPNYAPLLPFTRLVDVQILFSCDDGCSEVDDNSLIDLSQAMPGLQVLHLGSVPCRQFTGGATAKGLMALSHNCPNLSGLIVHFQVTTLSDPPTDLETTRGAGYLAPWTGCALTELEAGEILVPDGSTSTVALTLLRIFPQIETIAFYDEGWGKVEDVIKCSKGIIDYLSKQYHLTIL